MELGSSIISADSDVMGGIPVFAGTRVPVKTLLDYLEAGETLDEFLDHFPSVSRQQAIAVLELANEILTQRARAS
jgi:uncharacterized protein (DUF433 family)